MNELSMSLDEATGWFVANQELFIQYAVNIIALHFLILFIGLFVAKMVSKGVARILTLRHIDATVVTFLSVLVRYTVIAFTLIAVLGRLGFKQLLLSQYLCGRFSGWFSITRLTLNFAAGVLNCYLRPVMLVNT